MNPVRTYEYLCLSRAKVLDAVRALSAEQYERKVALALGSVASTVTHIMISEGFYVLRLTERPVPPYDQWPIKYEQPPAFAVIDEHWARQAQETARVISGERDWTRPISYVTLPDDQGRRSRINIRAEDLLAQLVLHEVHHRAQLMSMLRLVGGPVVEDIDYNALMYERVPVG
jgi:uncharacterized damage-inducible protein DinB